MRTLIRWKQLWDEQPDRMEQIRKAATKIAADKRHRRNLALKDILSQWPKTLSPEEFRQHIDILAPNLNPKSVVNRVRRLGYLTFAPAQLAWINHTRQGID
jgi:FKBP-type peptidyl-prolyl cis-trans isomerase (trigger factor)